MLIYLFFIFANYGSHVLTFESWTEILRFDLIFQIFK